MLIESSLLLNPDDFLPQVLSFYIFSCILFHTPLCRTFCSTLPGPEIIKLFLCSSQPSMKLQMHMSIRYQAIKHFSGSESLKCYFSCSWRLKCQQLFAFQRLWAAKTGCSVELSMKKVSLPRSLLKAIQVLPLILSFYLLFSIPLLFLLSMCFVGSSLLFYSGKFHPGPFQFSLWYFYIFCIPFMFSFTPPCRALCST